MAPITIFPTLDPTQIDSPIKLAAFVAAVVGMVAITALWTWRPRR